MKKNSNVGGLREGNDLHVCRQSSKISKSSCFQVKISQQGALLESSTLNHQDVASNIELLVRENGSDEDIATQDLFAGATLNIRKSPSSSFDSSYVEISGSLPAACPSILETIFSPIIESKEGNCSTNDDSEDGNSSSSDDQTCNVSDFHISDMSIVGFPFDENMGLDDISAANPCPEYQYMDTDMMFDMAQRYMILPSLEDDMETSNIHDVESIEEAPITSDDSYLCLAIQHMKPSDQNDDINYNSSELDEVDGFDPYLFIRNLPELSEVSPSLCPILQPKEIQKRSQVTLVLDLDETLVHSTLEYCDNADFTFSVYFNMKEHIIYVRQRPHLQMFLKRVAEMFEIIVFTASQSIYAEKLLNILDPDSKLISGRFYRESCIFSNGNYVKDLTILGVDLAKVAIIDNSPQVFQLQVNNGIPIESWFDDPSDHALISLLPFLEMLVDVDDVRPIIAQRFNND
ncbi:NLI interacting factor [Cinnamomum micranthum f. kanehirae]|uniref:NLI interacting factor n=1 Tax=Cinnamomum micranthum f. kanehirae TaxID=337451 RepID=A0A3S3PTI2_9MAGN|nr:NLI interacting factor [Cinnamomum micranthum f. kanehirae]